MLSIIVLSNRDNNFARLTKNLEETVKGPFEIVRIEDVVGGISKAYNIGASQSKFGVLCFVHDDVLFHTYGWNEPLTELLKEAATGVVGVMGGRYKSAFGLGWRDGKTDYYRMNVKSGTSGGIHLWMNPQNEATSEVLCLDGAFLCCRKEVWEQYRFDEETFTGFHFYDIDFSFRVGQHFKNYVSYRILLEHLSSGSFDRNYVLDGLKFEQKHVNHLPYSLEKISKKDLSNLEGYALTEKLSLMKKNSFSVADRLNLASAYFRKHRNLYQLARNLYFGFLRP